MNGFTLKKEQFEIINRLKKEKDRAELSLAIIEYAFNDTLPKKLSNMAQIAFDLLVLGINKSKSNAGRGGRPKGGKSEKSVFENENRIETENETELKPIENRIKTEEKTALIERERTKEKDITHKRELLQERKKERNIYKNINACACACEEGVISHEDIMEHYELPKVICSSLKEFLKHCYLNGHIVTNDKLSNIIKRLISYYTNYETGEMDEKGMVVCIERAISGGWFDIKIPPI